MKLLLIGDLHFGEKGNSRKHNQQTLDLIDWCIENYRGHVDAVIQEGDYFHDRTKVQLETLEAGILGAKKLSTAFGKENVYVLAGNHDIFYLNRLDTTSLRAIEPYATLIAEPTVLEDDKTVLTPWIVDEDHWKDVCDAAEQYEYVIGHFELNGFDMGGGYVMEHGYSPKALKQYTRVISGHYHSPQQKGNVTYTGIPFPVTMSEANKEMGVWLFDTEANTLEMVQYDKVKVFTLTYEQYKSGDYELDENTTIRVEVPDDISDDDLKALESDFEESASEFKIKYEGNKAKELVEADIQVTEVENIDDSVLNSFDQVNYKSDDIDPALLKKLYGKAMTYQQQDADA